MLNDIKITNTALIVYTAKYLTTTTMFIKVTSALLLDSAECDTIADSILNTAFSRYVGANDIANASDANEVS